MKSLLALASFAYLTVADQLHSPIRLRVNQAFLLEIFYSGDHKVFAQFEDMQFVRESTDQRAVERLTASVKPGKVNLDDYNFTVSSSNQDAAFV